MSLEVADKEQTTTPIGKIGRIPVRNLWLLMFYASELFETMGHGQVGTEASPDEVANLVAEILAQAVENRLLRRLSPGYQPASAILNRLRGRIDFISTERKQLLSKGSIACHFEQLTIDTLRNRYVRSALEVISFLASRPDLKLRCRSIATQLKSMGVSASRGGIHGNMNECFGRHDEGDRRMVAAAKLAHELALPLESTGTISSPLPYREEAWVRRLFERAVGGFYRVVLDPHEWNVHCGRTLKWQTTDRTARIEQILPQMRTDIVLENKSAAHSIVIDTKFTSILTQGWHREATLKSGHIYQLYAYLQSQAELPDGHLQNASGILLYPSIGALVDECVTIQGHRMRFATVDLTASTRIIREQLVGLASISIPIFVS